MLDFSPTLCDRALEAKTIHVATPITTHLHLSVTNKYFDNKKCLPPTVSHATTVSSTTPSTTAPSPKIQHHGHQRGHYVYAATLTEPEVYGRTYELDLRLDPSFKDPFEISPSDDDSDYIDDDDEERDEVEEKEEGEREEDHLIKHTHNHHAKWRREVTRRERARGARRRASSEPSCQQRQQQQKQNQNQKPKREMGGQSKRRGISSEKGRKRLEGRIH